MKSSTVKHSFPSARRRPRPSCWRNTVKLSVGRRNSTVFTSGMSIPSLYRSTTKISLISPWIRRFFAVLRSSSLDFPCKAKEGIPASSNTFAIYKACSTLTQKPSPFISSRSVTYFRRLFMIWVVRILLWEYSLSSSPRSYPFLDHFT
ncbi:hypothetical protein D3C81_1575970 [compost metagenome]